jgi:hypothetical protein
MPFDPTLPNELTLADAAQMRAQLNGLKALIDAAPTITAVMVDSVSTLPAGTPATVHASIVGSVLHLSFGLPTGPDGAPGGPGPQGPPFAAAIVDGVTTVDPGNPATVTAFFDGNNVHFAFSIPRGAQGEPGIQGPPGEVTTAALNSAIGNALTTAAGNSSANSNGVSTLDIPFTDDPLSLADGELLRTKINELITALRR